VAYFVSPFKWCITGVKVTSKRTAVIGIHIPGVNNRDRINVRLNIWDMITGKSIENKTMAVLDRWEAKCKAKNDEAKRLGEIETRIMSRRPPGQ